MSFNWTAHRKTVLSVGILWHRNISLKSVNKELLTKRGTDLQFCVYHTSALKLVSYSWWKNCIIYKYNYALLLQQSLQRWLDLERATVLHSLVVRRPLTLNCGDYCHLSFLVQTNAKSMADALALLEQPASTAASWKRFRQVSLHFSPH